MQCSKRICTDFILLLSLILFLTACGSGVEVTSIPTWTLIPEIVASSTPTAMDEVRVFPTSSFCLNSARFLEDLTIPDGSVVTPGETIDKRWSMQNSGECNWGPGYHLVRLGEDPLEGPDELALYPSRAGATAIWQVILKAPLEAGEYISRWQARSPEGNLFGDEVYLLILVKQPTPFPTPTPLIMP